MPPVVRLRTTDIWKRLATLSKRRAWRAVAVPFLGRGAARLLALQEDDILVVRFEDAVIRAGLVDPREVLGYIERGVRVFSATNLHAKVFVFGRTAVVGSSNVSVASERLLIEAVVETTAPRVVAAAGAFVQSLAGDEITPKFARAKIPLYRPPRRPAGPARPGVQHSTVWALGLTYVPWDADDEQEARAAQRSAAKLLDDPAKFRIETVSWIGETRLRFG